MEEINREAVEQHLLAGGTVRYAAWTFTKNEWRCHSGCCGDRESLEEILDTLEYFNDGDYSYTFLDT